MELNFKPRLTRGSHPQVTDDQQFCLVEALSYNVDESVNDHHESVDPVLAQLARHLNDRMCNHDDLVRGHAGYPGAKGEICNACQARLWAIGERIAGTGLISGALSDEARARLHARLAIAAAESVLPLCAVSEALHGAARSAIIAAADCLKGELSPQSARGVGDAAAAAAAAAAADAADAADASADAADASAYDSAYAAAAAAASAARGARAAAYAAAGASAADASADAARAADASADAARAADASADASADAADASADASADAAYAAAAAAEADVAQSMQLARKLINMFEAVIRENSTPQAEAPTAAAAAYAESVEVAKSHGAVPLRSHDPDEIARAAGILEDEEDELVTYFHELPNVESNIGEVGEVADEAIGDLARAETMLNSIADEHRSAETIAIRETDGSYSYYMQCCVVCRDAKGRPMPYPCRTMQIIQNYGGE